MPARRSAAGALLFSRTMLLFFGFFLLGSMAGAGVQAWLITVLHTVKGMDAGGRVRGADRLHGRLHLRRAGRRLVRRRAIEQHVRRSRWADDRVGGAGRWWWHWLSLPAVAVIGVMFASGLALGASRTPRDVMLKDASPPGQIGKVFGFVSAGLPLGSALTPVPFGMLIDRDHPELVLVLVARAAAGEPAVHGQRAGVGAGRRGGGGGGVGAAVGSVRVCCPRRA